MTERVAGLDPAGGDPIYRKEPAMTEQHRHQDAQPTSDEQQATIQKIRDLVESWDEQVDGPDAADFFVRLRPLLGIEQDDR